MDDLGKSFGSNFGDIIGSGYQHAPLNVTPESLHYRENHFKDPTNLIKQSMQYLQYMQETRIQRENRAVSPEFQQACEQFLAQLVSEIKIGKKRETSEEEKASYVKQPLSDLEAKILSFLTEFGDASVEDLYKAWTAPILDADKFLSKETIKKYNINYSENELNEFKEKISSCCESLLKRELISKGTTNRYHSKL